MFKCKRDFLDSFPFFISFICSMQFCICIFYVSLIAWCFGMPYNELKLRIWYVWHSLFTRFHLVLHFPCTSLFLLPRPKTLCAALVKERADDSHAQSTTKVVVCFEDPPLFELWGGECKMWQRTNYDDGADDGTDGRTEDGDGDDETWRKWWTDAARQRRQRRRDGHDGTDTTGRTDDICIYIYIYRELVPVRVRLGSK